MIKQINIDPEHEAEILDGCLYNMPYCPAPYSSIPDKYEFVKLIETVYRDGSDKTDCDIIGWICELKERNKK